MPKKLWKAKDLAARIKSKKQAEKRIRELLGMINGMEYKIKQANIRIAKHKKEIKLLEESWETE